MKGNKKKLTAGVAMVTAMALLLGGTFAWQSISQTALNEKEAIINPGGRLHDDFNGTDKNVYVENFADNDIYARVRLDEYFEIVMNKNTPAEKIEQIVGTDKNDTSTYVTHTFTDADKTTKDYWDWITGGSAVYMPTFNKNKDSLKADINGTFAENYEDYVEYTDGQDVTANATYDNDSNNVEDDGVTTVEETHYAKATEEGVLISMEDWLQLVEDDKDTDNYWVYDTDGWIYWSSPIKANTATGLLLDGIKLKNVMDDSYYYAINVVGQFITADDLGKEDNTGFYADAEQKPSENALKLLKKIGVTTGEASDNAGNTGEGDTTTSIFDGIEPGSTNTVEIDGVNFYVLAKNEDETLIWAKNSVQKSKFGSNNVWNEDCTAYQALTTWLGNTETLKDKAVNTTIYTSTSYDRSSPDVSTMTCKVFLLSEADVFGTANEASVTNTQEYTYGGKQLVTDSEVIKGGGETCWLRSPRYASSSVTVVNSGSSGNYYSYGNKLGLRPALWVKGL